MSDSQKFIARNRAPRVQIEYDVELYGAEKKVQLPFVMGVLSDLSGKSEQPPVGDLKFLEIDADNFDDRMKAMAPRAAFTVPNTLTGVGNLSVDLTFEKMADFTPEAIAAKVGSLAPLLEARRQLSDLMAYMDGKSGAEKLIETLLAQPGMLRALAGDPAAKGDIDAALATLKDALPAAPETADTTDATLSALADAAPPDAPAGAGVADILNGIAPVDTPAPDDGRAAALETLRAATVTAEPDRDDSADILSGLAAATPDDAPDDDTATDILSGIERTADAATEDNTDVLAGIARVAEPAETDATGDVLAGLDRVPDTAASDGTDDVLAGIAAAPEQPEPDDDLDALLAGLEVTHAADDADAALDDVLAGIAPMSAAEEDAAPDDILAGLDAPVSTGPAGDGLDDLLAGIAQPVPDVEGDDLDALLAGLEGGPDAEETAATADDILSGLETVAGVEPAQDPVEVLSGIADPATDTVDDDLDALLNDLTAATVETPAAAEDDLDALLAGLEPRATEAEDAPVAEDVLAAPDPVSDEAPDSDLDALLNDLGADDAASDAVEDDLDALLAGLDADDAAPEEDADTADVGAGDGLDDLLAELDDAAPGEADDLDALLVDLAPTDEAPGDDLDALLADIDTGVAVPAKRAQSPFGTISEPRPDRQGMNRGKFRIAILGDFTGRAARGLRETGDALAARRPIALDVDTVEEVIEGFATTLTLPVGRDGAGIDVKLGGLDDLHPDELYDNVAIFEEIAAIRQQLNTGSMADKTRERLQAWGAAHGTPVHVPRHSAATSVPAHRKLSDFQALIGDNRGQLAEAGPIDAMIAQIVGPHVVRAPDSGTDAMLKAVDQALSAAMRLVLHHPDFQALESQWRSLDLLARRIETDSTLEIVLYDISAEEMAIDLAAQEDLSASGLFRLLTGVLDPEEGAGGFSALCGMYTFEETPPHAELLARIGLVAEHFDAPFFAAITPAYLDTAKEDRHPLVARAWDSLRTTSQAGYLGLVSPRVLLRLPYGRKSDPCDAFDFEEFTLQEGLSGMLWANPVVLVAILLAATYKKDGKAMEPGSVMSIGDMPFHYVTDRHGDQVALPCTERNLAEGPVQASLARGYMPVVSIKGRNEVRLASFRSLAGTPIAGAWTDVPPPARTPPAADITMEIAVAPDLPDATDDDDLAALLAGFDDDAAPDADDDAMDPELAALLEGL